MTHLFPSDGTAHREHDRHQEHNDEHVMDLLQDWRRHIRSRHFGRTVVCLIDCLENVGHVVHHIAGHWRHRWHRRQCCRRHWSQLFWSLDISGTTRGHDSRAEEADSLSLTDSERKFSSNSNRNHIWCALEESCLAFSYSDCHYYEEQLRVKYTDSYGKVCCDLAKGVCIGRREGEREGGNGRAGAGGMASELKAIHSAIECSVSIIRTSRL